MNKSILVILRFRKYELLEEFFCTVLYYKIPYVIVREDKEVCEELGIKNLSALGIIDENLAQKFSFYSSKCMIEIPWLINTEWISLKVAEK